jgi:hypothetical protein
MIGWPTPKADHQFGGTQTTPAQQPLNQNGSCQQKNGGCFSNPQYKFWHLQAKFYGTNYHKHHYWVRHDYIACIFYTLRKFPKQLTMKYIFPNLRPKTKKANCGKENIP